MNWFNTLLVAFRALRRNKLRSVLTALGIIIGVGAVIAMVSIGNGAKSQIESQVANLGQNIVQVFPGSMSTGGMRSGWGGASTLTPEDADAIGREVGNIDGVSVEVRDRAQILANGLNWQTQILGVAPDYPYIRSWPVAAGAVFSEQDVRTMGKVAVIGKTIADQLFPNQDPLGQTLRIRENPFKIIGVLGAKGFNLFGQDQDDVVMIPYTSHMRRVSRRTFISSIMIAAKEPEVIEKVQQDVTDLLTQRRRGREPDFTVRNQVELAQARTEQSRTMTFLLAAIAAVSLIVGGIGVMNIMLVSVTERTREIGIRLAIGAHGGDVLRQFLIEAVTISCLGGLIGVATGIGVSEVIRQTQGWPIEISIPWICISFATSGVIGVGFGFFPALKASNLDPIDALRFE